MAETNVTQDAAALAREKARQRLACLGPMIRPLTAQEKVMVEETRQATAAFHNKGKMEYNPKFEELTTFTVREILSRNPFPETADPVTRTLLGGCDPVAAHQALTLTFPLFAFLGHNARVIYNDGTLRWVAGQSWQMGGSGRGKSVVLRALETQFLSKEIRENSENAQIIAAYSLLSEKEQKETAKPEEKLTIIEGVPTAIALLEQMQINEDDAIYISCTECGEFGKKIGSTYYNVLLDMMKKSYDGVGEPFIHKTSAKTLFTSSMKICFNIGGTEDPMIKIFRNCNADGTLSRGNLTILAERKDEDKDGAYKAPSWTEDEKLLLWEAADRLRNTNNTFKEHAKITSDPECGALLEKFGFKVAEDMPPRMEQLESAVAQERLDRAYSVPEVLLLGQDIKTYLASLGDMASDCCSRADERAMGLCYLLLIANGYHFNAGHENAGDDGVLDESVKSRDAQLVQEVLSVVSWWVLTSIDCAMAIQTCINAKIVSEKGGILNAFGKVSCGRIPHEVAEARDAAFKDFEEKRQGELVSINDLRVYEVFAELDFSTLYRLTKKRGWKAVKKGFYHMPEREQEANA